jgi:serine/threonine-protein kinase RsbW
VPTVEMSSQELINHLVLRSHDTKVIPEELDRITKRLEEAGFSEKDIFGVRLSLEEAIINGMKHGNASDPEKALEVKAWFEQNRQYFIAEIKDQGPGFDPDRVADPTADENLEKEGGRGLLLMRHYMEVKYNEKGNIVTLAKHIRDKVRLMVENS